MDFINCYEDVGRADAYATIISPTGIFRRSCRNK
jgi:hypothetical protein